MDPSHINLLTKRNWEKGKELHVFLICLQRNRLLQSLEIKWNAVPQPLVRDLSLLTVTARVLLLAQQAPRPEEKEPRAGASGREGRLPGRGWGQGALLFCGCCSERGRPSNWASAPPVATLELHTFRWRWTARGMLPEAHQHKNGVLVFGGGCPPHGGVLGMYHVQTQPYRICGSNILACP